MLRRTPPPTSPAPQPKENTLASSNRPVSTTEKTKSPIQHYESEPDLHSLTNITERKKRKYNEESMDFLVIIKEMFSFAAEQDKRFNELRASIELMSNKYDDFLLKLSSLEKDKQADKAKIQELEEKLENLESKSRGVGIEVRNLPIHTGETKESLQTEIIKLGKTLSVNIDQNSIKDIYRIKSKDASSPVIVDFTSVLKKEKMLKAVKQFNKSKEKGSKLNTTHLNRDYQSKPLYVSETLTAKNQKLFYIARQFQKSHGYSFCWTANGVVYLKQNKGSSFVRINDFNDLDSLRKAVST